MLQDLEDKYLRSSEFRTLVSMIERFMVDGKITPQDVRDAAFIAGIRIARNNPTLFFPPMNHKEPV